MTARVPELAENNAHRKLALRENLPELSENYLQTSRSTHII